MCLRSLCIELGSCWQPHYPSWDYESDDDIEDSEEEVDVEEEEVDSEVSDGDGNGIKSTSEFGFEFAKGGTHWFTTGRNIARAFALSSHILDQVPMPMVVVDGCFSAAQAACFKEEVIESQGKAAQPHDPHCPTPLKVVFRAQAVDKRQRAAA